MKTLTKMFVAASALALAPVAPAAAQTVAYTDVQQVLGMSQAAKTADQQMRVTYKATYDQIESRSRVLQAELNAMIVKYQADQKTNPNNPTLATQEELARAAGVSCCVSAVHRALKRLGVTRKKSRGGRPSRTAPS